MLLNIAANGFAKKTSLGKGINSIGASKRFATSNPKINPTDLLISKSVGIVLIWSRKVFLSWRNTKPAAKPTKKPIIAKTILKPSTLDTCLRMSTGNKSTPSHPEAAPDNTNKINT